MSDRQFPIGLDPDRPLTGSLRESFSADMNSYVAEMLARFKQIYLPYPRHSEFHGRCDYLVKLGQATRGEPQMGLRVLAPTGSGKTAAAKAFMRLLELKAPRTTTFVPVVYISLEQAATSKKLMMAILNFFGDKFSSSGNEMTLRQRVNLCFARFGTHLLIIDEVQHLNYYRREGNDITDSLKRFLDDGVVPILFLGTEEATDLFKRNLQLNGRLLPPADFAPLSTRRTEDTHLMTSFVNSLDRAIIDRGILPMLAGLRDPWIQGCLHAVSQGVIGRVSRLIAVSLEIALRRGAECIEVYDLALATDRWAVPQNFLTYNPFRGGKR